MQKQKRERKRMSGAELIDACKQLLEARQDASVAEFLIDHAAEVMENYSATLMQLSLSAREAKRDLMSAHFQAMYLSEIVKGLHDEVTLILGNLRKRVNA